MESNRHGLSGAGVECEFDSNAARRREMVRREENAKDTPGMM